MAEILLSNGQVALVDDEDFEWLNKFCWYQKNHGYVACHPPKVGNKRPEYLLHRLIMGIEKCGREIEVDHINNNKLDNRRSNLRLCTRSENMRNATKRRNCTSKYKGVSLNKRTKRWLARYAVNGTEYIIGTFLTEEAAARAYDAAIRSIFGAFAKLNFPEEINNAVTA
jgi:hypothetical protein